jgi:DNA repair protein REV1
MPPAGGAGEERARAVAREVQREVRTREPALDTRPRTSRDDPDFVSHFFKASRLHFIGSWKQRYNKLLETLPPPPPLPPPLQPSGERAILHIDMDCFFCAVGMRGRPELRDMPVAICWSKAESDKASHGEISSVQLKPLNPKPEILNPKQKSPRCKSTLKLQP